MTVDPSFWCGRRVLLTGHTGFKGAWLALWLQTLGAHVTGFSLGVPTQPSLYELAGVGEGMESIEGDVRDHRALAAALDSVRPEVVVHMAAQSLVRRSLRDPRETYEINVMGTVNLLDAVRGCWGPAHPAHPVRPAGAARAARPAAPVRVVLNVTSDKCYENREWEWAYREDEPLGGRDPYSSSKGCSELVTAAFRRSFFASEDAPRVASARAGNAIGGGDWSGDRLIPDLMRAALADEAVLVRNPGSTRPWQHVLNPLSGYLTLIQALWSAPELAGGWNFGPGEEDVQTVSWIAHRIAELWPEPLRLIEDPEPGSREARQLRLDSARARARLGWRPSWDLEAGLSKLVHWYATYRTALATGDARALSEQMRAETIDQINAFQHAAVLA